MITFHPTIPIRRYIKSFFTQPSDPEPRLSALFPGHDITLTDSGRSALAHIIETLGLEHKRMALPAFLCDNILPVLEHYDIKPVFLDIDPLTYQPTEAAYKTPCDAVLLVATYGKIPDPSIIQSLQNRGIVVIEDWAHVSLPLSPIDRIDGNARYYSFSKTLPVPDGGLAVIPSLISMAQNEVDPCFSELATTKQGPRSDGHMPHTTLASIKDVKKLIPFVAALLAFIRLKITRQIALHPSWNGLARMRPLSRRFLGHALDARTPAAGYCLPIRANDPAAAQRLLFKNGIIAERLWNTPIIDLAAEASAKAGATKINRVEFPNTNDAAQHVICAPLWHIKNDEEKAVYEREVVRIVGGS